MPQTSQTIAAYSPWSNATLTFQVPGTTLNVNTDTGNYNYNEETVEYIAYLAIQPPNWKSATGTDQTTYNVSGRLLSPSTLDARITNGSQALATLNGVEGRFELVFDLSMHAASRPDLKQPISGIFRVTGGG
jgi:hypothetical protein